MIKREVVVSLSMSLRFNFLSVSKMIPKVGVLGGSEW